MSSSKVRLARFDIAKAICIILVALGHFNPEYSPIWYKNFVEGFCSFHMPVFMFASGYLYLAFKKQIPYKQFIVKKCHRLMLPYFVVSVFIISIKLISEGGSLYVQHPVTYEAFIKILYYPEAAYFLWFAWALFDIFVFIPLFDTKNKRIVLFIISVVLHYIDFSLPEIFCLKEMQTQLVWFVCGLLCVDFKENLSKINNIRLINAILYMAFFVSYICICFYGAEKMAIAKGVLSWIGIYVVMHISIMLERIQANRYVRWLISLGVSSYIVYLFHTTFEGLVKSLFVKFGAYVEFNNELFVIQALIVTFIGVCIPFLLYKYILKKNKITKFLFGI